MGERALGAEILEIMNPLDVAPHSARSETSRSSPRPRSQSMSSDRPSLTGFGGLQSPPALTSPDPAFIAPSAASQIVTNDHDSHTDTWFDQHGIEPSGETALVAPPALKLVNRFLDQILFNFLSVSRSTSLASLRPAVGEVLKPKLAKEAINGADQELYEYLGGEEDEELLALHNGLEATGDWDLELVWKRTRLRCMVYSSLGDMEEEDEDFYTEQEQLACSPNPNSHFPDNPGVVSPAVAIFLTSILEFMGEQILVVAGQAAYHRLRAKHEKGERDGSGTPGEIAERVVVEELDMERVALDRTLGRLWRGWKKRIRSPTASVCMARSFSRESLLSQPQTSRAASVAPEDQIKEDIRRPSLAAVLAEHEHAASIPLPISLDDIREIEIPGLTSQSDDEDDGASSEDEGFQLPTRPKSLLIFTYPEQNMPLSNYSLSDLPHFLSSKSRKRSNSLPSHGPSPYYSPRQPKPNSETFSQDQKSINEPNVLTDETEFKNDYANEDVIEKELHDETIAEPAEQKSLVAGVVAGAVAIGVAAAAGITAAAKGEAPQTTLGRGEETEEEEEEEEFIEEPQILTSSRVSMGGRISPDEAVVPSRRSSTRSHSVHSLRIIEVTSPKTSLGSRTPSVEHADYASMGRSITSRPSSIHSPILSDTQAPRVSSPISRTINGSPLARNGSSLSSRQQRNSAEEPISEEQERDFDDPDSPPMTAVPADLAAAMSGVDFYPSPTSQNFTSEPVSREVTPKAAAFVLSSPPPPRNAARMNAGSHMNDNQKSLQSSNLAVSPRSIDNGAPPLTPLREMMEVAPDTSDEASSSYDAHSMSEHTGHDHSPTVSASSVSHGQRERVVRSQPNGLRSSPPRPSREDYTRKESFPKAHRPSHTSGSTSSSTSHKLKPVRTSEESGPHVENKSQSFEQLIRSDQTIQFTLTPQNMRNIEVRTIIA